MFKGGVVHLVLPHHPLALAVLCCPTQAWLRTEVTNAVQQYLHVLQHPANCTRARKLLCDLNKGCGFGCEMHHVAHCLATAIALNRTMILKVITSSETYSNLSNIVVTSAQFLQGTSTSNMLEAFQLVHDMVVPPMHIT